MSFIVFPSVFHVQKETPHRISRRDADTEASRRSEIVHALAWLQCAHIHLDCLWPSWPISDLTLPHLQDAACAAAPAIQFWIWYLDTPGRQNTNYVLQSDFVQYYQYSSWLSELFGAVVAVTCFCLCKSCCRHPTCVTGHSHRWLVFVVL